MSCIHTIYGALTATFVLMDKFESVEISECQNTKRIVNAFLIHKSKCRPLAVTQPIAAVAAMGMPQHLHISLKINNDKKYLQNRQIAKEYLAFFQ